MERRSINYKLHGRVALVTGAGSGIGRAASIAYARSGASVLVSDVNADSGEQTVDLIRQAGGRATFRLCDVSDGEAVKAMVSTVVQQFGRLDCAFNNAGINWITLDEYEDAVWARSVGVNLTGVMHCMREEAAVMVRNGGGSIVNTSSMNGIVGNSLQPAYTATKHGVIGLTRHGALRWAKEGIRVNAICPGVTETGMTTPLMGDPEMRALIESLTPMGRTCQPGEIAEAVMWLSSDAASFVTGHALVIDGGATVD